jgi:hypothetical protein
MKNPILQTISILLILFLALCCTQKTQAGADNAALIPVKSNEILFINLKMAVNSASEKSISLINVIKSTGKLKNSGIPFSAPTQGTFLMCTFLNGKKKKIEERAIEHPLIRSVESFEENGTMKQNAISLPSAEFSLRLQNDFDIQSIVIREVLNGKESKTPFTINLDAQ